MIYLLRHGQTEWNIEGRKQGQGNSSLTELGISQSAACGGKLAELTEGQKMLTMYVSPLQRAKDTAEYILPYLSQVKEMFFDDALMELNYGVWEGYTNEEVDELFPGERKKRNRDRWNYVIQEGESYAMVHRRIEAWMEKTTGNCSVIVIAHEMISRLIRGTYLRLTNDKMLQLTHPHTSVFCLSKRKIQEFKA